jgi:hypothetical protein
VGWAADDAINGAGRVADALGTRECDRWMLHAAAAAATTTPATGYAMQCNADAAGSFRRSNGGDGSLLALRVSLCVVNLPLWISADCYCQLAACSMYIWRSMHRGRGGSDAHVCRSIFA